MKLKNKIALITGAGSGIGYTIAVEFVKEGAEVAILGRTEKKILKAKSDIEAMGGAPLPLIVDVSDINQVRQSVEETYKKFNRIDLLVNNAGVSSGGKMVDVPEDEWDKVMDINLNGIFFFCKEVGKKMIKQKSGKIINISSIAGVRSEKFNTAYSASKSAVISLTQGTALEMAEYGINVNVICPGFTYTEMQQNFLKTRAPLLNMSPEQLKKKLENGIPLGRIGKPYDVARLAVFLASEESSYITGQAIIIDGGVELTKAVFDIPKSKF